MLNKSTKIKIYILGLIFLVGVLISGGVSSIVEIKNSLTNSDAVNKDNLVAMPSENDKPIYEAIPKEDLETRQEPIYEMTEEDMSSDPGPRFEVINFEILDKYIKQEKYELQEIYSGIGLALMGKLKEDTSFYIEESSIVVDGDYVSFDLMYVSSKKPFDTLKLQYRYN